MKKFWSIEWTDGEGDLCVRHATMTDAEAMALMDQLVSNGMSATLHDLTPPQAVDPETAAVLSAHDGKAKQLGGPS